MKKDKTPAPDWLYFDEDEISFVIAANNTLLDQTGEYLIDIEVTANDVHKGWECNIIDWKIKLITDADVKGLYASNKLVLIPGLQN